MVISNRQTTNFIFAVLFCLFSIGTVASPADYYKTVPSKGDNPAIVKDNPIISNLDSLAKLTFKGMPDYSLDRTTLNKYNYAASFVPTFSDSVYQARIQTLSKQSPFGYVYNPLVKQYIDLYAFRSRALTEKILGLSKVYFPMFEEQLDRFNLPLELKFLAVIESALLPSAKSWAGAKGLWQFMYSTGIQYDLKVNSYIDERSDPYKGTVAACRLLKDLYTIYGDWPLALAAYNCGPGNVNKAIRRAGGIMDFWSIMQFLPRETRDYVPAFIAASYVMHYATEHNLYPVFPGILAADIDTVTVKKAVSFDQIAEMFKIPIENLRFLNPSYLKDFIPASPENTYMLRLPSTYVADYINNEEALYAFKTQKAEEKEKLLAQFRQQQERTLTHTVKYGENLVSIANKYNCSVYDLKKWNNLKKNYVKRNQQLVIYLPEKKEAPVVATVKDTLKPVADNKKEISETSFVGPPTVETFLGPDAEKMLAKPPVKNNSLIKNSGEQYFYHTIRYGDTLWSIANKYKGVTVDNIKEWNKLKPNYSLKPGQKLKIAKKVS